MPGESYEDTMSDSLVRRPYRTDNEIMQQVHSETEAVQSDSEAERRKREQASGYYRDTIQPFAVSAVQQDKYTITNPLDKVSRKAAAADSFAPVISKAPDPAPAPGSQPNPTAIAVGNETSIAQLSQVQLADQIERLYGEYQRELDKGDKADLEKLCRLALAMFAMWQRLSSHNDQEESAMRTAQLSGNVKKVQGTFNHIGSIILTVASSILSIVGGAVGMAGGGMQLGGVAGAAATRAESLVKMGGFGSTIAQGTQMPSKLFDESNQAQRTYESHVLEEKKRRRDQDHQNSQKATQSGDANSHASKEQDRQHHEAKKSVLGINS